MRGFFFLIVLSLLIFLPLIGAIESFGYLKQGENIRITQTCDDATYINITSISFPSSEISVSNVPMSSLGNTEFYYDYNDTNQLGRYDIRGVSDGCTNTFLTYFIVTTNGKEPAEGIIVVVFSLFFIGIVSFGLIYFIISLGHLIQLDMDLIDTTIMISNYLGLWIFYYISFEYLGNAVINNILELAISIGAVTHVFLPLIGFLVSFIMTNLKFKQKARITY
jgi:hypothetical protein